MKRTLSTLAVLGLMSLSMTGCVGQKKHDDLETLYRKSQEQVMDLQAKLEEANARLRALEGLRGKADSELADQLAKVMAERDKLSKALKDAEDKLRIAPPVQTIMLEPELDQALKELAASDPDLMSFDSKLGMVRFNADLTFALGSTEVNKNAEGALAKLAEILKRPVAAKYEAKVVGHTDNVPISKAETKAKHPTNWHLSVHRSIAVKDVLQKAGIEPTRIQVAGYGEFRPVAANAKKGEEKNRRVEIYLVKMYYNAPAGGVPAVDAAVPAESVKPLEPAKKDDLKSAGPEEFK